MAHRYRITLEPLDGAAPLSENGSLSYQLDMHDDLRRVLDRARERPVVPDEEVVPFVLGLKLFGEVFLRHRKTPPFSGLASAFRDFMIGVKRGERGAAG